MKTQTMDDAYRQLLNEVFTRGQMEVNARTGVKILALRGGHSFKLDLFDTRLPVPGNRRYWPRVAAAEVAWQFMGTQDPEWILAKAPKIWSDFVEDGKLKTSYGYRWKEHFGRDQLTMAINELNNNPTNRQLYVSAWDPSADGLGGPNQPKNIPCPVGFSVSRIGVDLHMSVFIRSSDIFIGLPYDVMGYALTLDAICQSVPGTRTGTIHFTLAHPHIYEPHFKDVQACIGRGEHSHWASECEPFLPMWSVPQIEEDPDGYLEAVRGLAKEVRSNEWNPAPAIVL